jgi:hypothetical protein
MEYQSKEVRYGNLLYFGTSDVFDQLKRAITISDDP